MYVLLNTFVLYLSSLYIPGAWRLGALALGSLAPWRLKKKKIAPKVWEIYGIVTAMRGVHHYTTKL